MLRLLSCRSLRWTHVRHCAAKETEQRIQKEICKALGGSTSWIPVSRVSSALADETCEELAELGGLAKFCGKLCKENARPQFYVKSVDGVMCLRLNKVRSPKEVVSDVTQLEYKKLMDLSKLLPGRPANLASCQRVWNLQSIYDTERRLTEIVEEISNMMAKRYPDRKNSNFVQIGYHGKNVLCVSQRATALFNVDEETSSGWEDEDFSPIYDLWRMSRYLRTDEFIPIDAVAEGTIDMLQTPLLQIALTYPQRISLQLGSTAQVVEANRFYINGDLFGEKREVIGLKFLLTDDEIAKNLISTNKFSVLTDEELRLERQKLKELPPLRRQKLRRNIVREEFRRKFPKGNPFLNPDVVALHLYDSMEPGVFYNNANLRESYLPDGGKATMHVGIDFFENYTHLFITQGITTTSVNVMRREQNMVDASSDAENWKKNTYSDEEILLALISQLNTKKEDWVDSKRSLEVFVTLLPRHIFKFLQTKGRPGSVLLELLQRFPDVFEITIEDPQKILARVSSAKLGELGAQLVNQASDTVIEEKKGGESS